MFSEHALVDHITYFTEVLLLSTKLRCSVLYVLHTCGCSWNSCYFNRLRLVVLHCK